jgi:hypothetical protein
MHMRKAGKVESSPASQTSDWRSLKQADSLQLRSAASPKKHGIVQYIKVRTETKLDICLVVDGRLENQRQTSETNTRDCATAPHTRDISFKKADEFGSRPGHHVSHRHFTSHCSPVSSTLRLQPSPPFAPPLLIMVASSALPFQPHRHDSCNSSAGHRAGLRCAAPAALAWRTLPKNGSHASRIARDAARSYLHGWRRRWEFRTFYHRQHFKNVKTPETSPNPRLTFKRSHGPCPRYARP